LKRLFYEEAEEQPVVLSFQFLKLVLIGLNLVDFAVKPIQSVISTKQPIVFLIFLTKFC